MGGFQMRRFHLLFLAAFSLLAAVCAHAASDNYALIDLDGVNDAWITLEQDIQVPPGVKEIPFIDGVAYPKLHISQLRTPRHCKIVLQGSDTSPRRITAKNRTPFQVKSATIGKKSRQEISTQLLIDGATIKFLECSDTTLGIALSMLPQANYPTYENFTQHFGRFFSLRRSISGAEIIVDP